MKSNIRNLRNEKKISQTTLANVLGKTQQAVSHMENDRDRISIESLITMSDYFGVSTDYILGVEPKEKTQENDNKNKKILYQMLLSLLLCSLDDDPQALLKARENNV